jgi:hypothetical protein
LADNQGKSGKAPLLKRVERRNWFILVGMIVISFSLLPLYFSLGVLIGGVLSIISYYWLYEVVKRAITHTPAAGKITVMLWYYVRLLSIGIVLYLVISRQWVDPIGLLIGLSVVVLNILFTTIRDYKKILLEV